jgi:hypothetical protein
VKTSKRTPSASQVRLDPLEHEGRALASERVQPLGLGPIPPDGTVARGDRRRHRDQLLQRIEPLRHRPRIIPQCLEVAMVNRPRQYLDLRPGIVDVVLAGHGEPGKRQELRQGIAEHRPPPVPDMERPGRVGRAELDIDLLATARGRPPVIRTGRQHHRHLRLHEGIG